MEIFQIKHKIQKQHLAWFTVYNVCLGNGGDRGHDDVDDGGEEDNSGSNENECLIQPHGKVKATPQIGKITTLQKSEIFGDKEELVQSVQSFTNLPR